jgi:Salmonella virulence plasmid 65kDa B protein
VADDELARAARARLRSPARIDSTESKSLGEKPTDPVGQPEIPKVELPRGGGALKSIDEKFQVNAANGTATLSVPLPFSQARSGFVPALKLGYDSGNGNGPLGQGWSLGETFIQRRTDKLLPRYRDVEDSDVFVWGSAEDMVPTLVRDGMGKWQADQFTAPTGERVKRFRPRIEGDFARIERITPPGSETFFWKVITRENVVTFYGRSATSRIADPSDSTRVFRWLPELSYDDKGNCLEFGYQAEDLRRVPHAAPEGHRQDGLAPCANTYLKWVKYGNKAPYTQNPDQPYAPAARPADYFFQMVVDYGDHDPDVPTPAPQKDWPCRLDPFSWYKAGFDVRTYRLCQRLLFFHFFKELDDGVNPAPCLVRSLDIAYRYFGNAAATASELRNVEVDYPLQLALTHYRKNGTGYDRASLPPLTFAYQELSWSRVVQEVSREDLAGA